MKHSMHYRVPYADSDQMGVVYYANYFRYFEQSRTEMLRSFGMPYSELEKQGVFLMVSEAECKYLSPAHYDEWLTFTSWISERRAASMVLSTEVSLDGKILARGSVKLACLDANGKMARLPGPLASLPLFEG